MDGGRPRRQLVGRSDELDQLSSAFAAAANGQATTVFIGGEAGIGKSRLLSEVRGQLREAGAIVAVGSCLPGGAGLPYAPVVGVLRELVSHPDVDVETGALQPLLAGSGLAVSGMFGTDVGYTYGPRMVDGLARTRLFESILDLLSTIGARRPIVLGFEDMHWADSASAALIDFLTRNLGSTPVLLVATYRSDELSRGHSLHNWLVEIRRHSDVRHFELAGLGPTDLATLISRLTSNRHDSDRVRQIAARSQGNAFFVEELCAAPDDSEIPTRLREVVLARVDLLAPAAQQMLRCAAAIGTEFDHSLLAVVCGRAPAALDPATIDAAATQAVNQHILEPLAGTPRLRFRHQLLRDAVYETVLPHERSGLHLAIATVLAANPALGSPTPSHRAAELAGHWWASGDQVRCIPSSIDAAHAAVGVLAYPEALIHLEHTISVADSSPEVLTAVDLTYPGLLEWAADVAFLGNNGVAGVELAKRAIAASPADEPSDIARLHALLGRNAWVTGDTDLALESYRLALELLPPGTPSADLAQVHAQYAGVLMMAENDAAIAHCELAIDAARAVGARDVESHALNTLGCLTASLGQPVEGTAYLREALAIAEAVSKPHHLSRAYTNLSWVLVAYGELEAAAALLFDSVAVDEALWGIRLNGTATNSGEALMRLGRYDETEALLAEVGTHALGVCQATPYLLAAPIAIYRGHFDRARELLESADQKTGLDDVQLRADYFRRAAELAIAEGRYDDADHQVHRGLDLVAGVDELMIRPTLAYTGVMALADRHDEARSSGVTYDLDQLREAAARIVEDLNHVIETWRETGRTVAPSAIASAATAAAERSRLDRSDPELWLAAASLWANAREPYPAAYCRWREAEALLAGRSGRQRAADSLGMARRTCVELATDPLLTRIERLAQRARIELDQPAETGPDRSTTIARDLGLTAREVEVLGQLAAGRTDREMADVLFISRKTASCHVSNLLRKLDVPNRVVAGRLGQDLGLVELAAL